MCAFAVMGAINRADQLLAWLGQLGEITGWLQAIGGMLAVWAAFKVAGGQANAAKQTALEEKRLLRLLQLQVVQVFVSHASGDLGLLGDTILLRLMAPDAWAKSALERMVHAEELMAQIPPHEIPDVILLHRVATFRSQLAHLRSQVVGLIERPSPGHRDALMTLAKTMKARAEKTIDYTNELIDEIQTQDELMAMSRYRLREP